MRRTSAFTAGADLVVLVMTSLTFDTTEVLILSANSAVTPPTASVRSPVSPALTAGWATVLFFAGAAVFAAAALLADTWLAAAGAATLAEPAFTLAACFAAAAALFLGTAVAPAAGAFDAVFAGRAAGLAAALALGGASDSGAGVSTPAILFASAEATAFTTPLFRSGAAALWLPVFLAGFATVSFILPSRCLPLAALACWQFSRQTKAMQGSRFT